MNKNPKSSWRFIPKPVYQGIAILLLLACFALTVETVWQQVWLFRIVLNWLGEEQWWLAAFLTFLIVFVGWVIIMLPLRLFSQLPTYSEELEAAGAEDFKQLYQKQREKMYLDEAGPLTPEQQGIRSRSLAIGGLLLGLIAGIATVVIFLIGDLIWLSGIVITLVSLIMGSWHGLKSMRLSRRS